MHILQKPPKNDTKCKIYFTNCIDKFGLLKYIICQKYN